MVEGMKEIMWRIRNKERGHFIGQMGEDILEIAWERNICGSKWVVERWRVERGKENQMVR